MEPLWRFLAQEEDQSHHVIVEVQSESDLSTYFAGQKRYGDNASFSSSCTSGTASVTSDLGTPNCTSKQASETSEPGSPNCTFISETAMDRVHKHERKRRYFKCAGHGCRVTRTVGPSEKDESLLRVTYKGRHTCQSTQQHEDSDKSPLFSNKQPKATSQASNKFLGVCHPASLAGAELSLWPVVDDAALSKKPCYKGLTGAEMSLWPVVDDAALSKKLCYKGLAGVELSLWPVVDDAALSKKLCYKGALPTEDVSVTQSTPPLALISPMESIIDTDPNAILVRLEITRHEGYIFVGAIVHSEFLEFHFFNAKNMATCIGVGLPGAGKVILHNDLNITIQGTSVPEELKNSWMPFLSDESCHLVMKVDMEAADMQADEDGHNMQTFVREKGDTLSWLRGVGFDSHAQYFDETYNAKEVSWPLLYDMALFILTANDQHCNETNGNPSAQGSSIQNKLHQKRDSVFHHENFQDVGDGDEDEFGPNSSASGDDDPPIVLKITVHPPTKCEILDTQEKPNGLAGATIAPKLVFEFRQNHECKRISIKTETRLELASTMNVFNNTELFGWYHTGIQIFFGCEDTQGHPESGRVAILKQNSCKILNQREPYKYTIAKSIVSSNADTYTTSGQAGLKVNNAWVGGIKLESSSSGSRMQQVATSSGGNIETIRQTICNGFSFRDFSSTEFPARAGFLLFYPLENLSIWDNREFLQGEGLFATIEPSIEGTWIPLNGLEASPYLFKAVRSLKFHARVDGLQDKVVGYNQEYVLPFFVNHAMTHLRSQRSKHIELSGDRQFVPNVLTVGSVY